MISMDLLLLAYKLAPMSLRVPSSLRVFAVLLLLGAVARGAELKPYSGFGCSVVDDYFANEVWAKVAAESCLKCHKAGGDAEDSKLVLRNPNGPTPPTVNCAALVTMRDDLQAKHTDITGQMNNVQIAAAALRIMKEALHLRGGQFNDAVRSDLAGTTFAEALPLLPQPGDGQGIFVEPMDDVATLWPKINAAAGIAGFQSDRLEGRTAAHGQDRWQGDPSCRGGR